MPDSKQRPHALAETFADDATAETDGGTSAAMHNLSEADMLRQIDEGLADIKAGRVVPGDAVLAKMQTKIEEHLKKTLVENGNPIG